MKIILRAMLMYPFVIIMDIGTFFCRLFENIKCSFNKIKFDYNDIVEIGLYDEDVLALDSDSIIIYEKGNDKPDSEYAKIISLEKNKFNELKSLLKENRILEYRRNIFRFRITPLWYLWCADIGDFGETLILKFKDGQTFRVDSYCTSKRFDRVAKYLREM